MSKQDTIAVNGVFVEFTTNSNGVKIKKCCASCAHHNPYENDGPKRLCKKHTTTEGGNEKPKVMDKSDLCNDWSISNFIDKIKLNK